MRTLRIPLGGLFLVGLAAALAVLVLGQGGARPAAAQPPPAPHYMCYQIAGDPLGVPVDLETQFGLELGVEVLDPTLLCLPALKNGVGDLTAPHLKCYNIVADDPEAVVHLRTQFGEELNVEVGKATRLCVPALKAIAPEEPTGILPPAPHYECYQIAGPPLVDVLVDLETQFGLELGVEVLDPSSLCAPALKNGEGDLTAPHLKCYNIEIEGSGGPPVNLRTQFGDELAVPVGQASQLCVPATKNYVGGIAELPALAGTSGEEAATPAGGSGWSSANYAALAAGLAAAAVALSAGGWYARRRWIR